VRTGFDQWFKVADGAPPPAAWKMNMLVLMNLYPVVFVFGVLARVLPIHEELPPTVASQPRATAPAGAWHGARSVS